MTTTIRPTPLPRRQLESATVTSLRRIVDDATGARREAARHAAAELVRERLQQAAEAAQ
jgi:hypothetical protein